MENIGNIAFLGCLFAEGNDDHSSARDGGDRAAARDGGDRAARDGGDIAIRLLPIHLSTKPRYLSGARSTFSSIDQRLFKTLVDLNVGRIGTFLRNSFYVTLFDFG